MSLYKWEHDALIKGRMQAQIDEREQLAELAANLRYTLYAKNVKQKTLFDKSKEIRDLDMLFDGKTKDSPHRKRDIDFAEKIAVVNEHFKNKQKRSDDE